jgi:hypothetical protein
LPLQNCWWVHPVCGHLAYRLEDEKTLSSLLIGTQKTALEHRLNKDTGSFCQSVVLKQVLEITIAASFNLYTGNGLKLMRKIGESEPQKKTGSP